jgi:hypothetical protein
VAQLRFRRSEADALTAALESVKAANPGLTVNVLPVDFGAIFN